MRPLRILLLAVFILSSARAIELEPFTAQGNPKTLGINFTVGHPKEWTSRPTNSPAVIAAFALNPEGLSDSMTLVVPRGQNLSKRDVTKEEFRPLFESPEMEKIMGQSLPGSTMIQKKYLADFKYPAGFLDYSLTLKLPGGEQTLRVRNYIIYLRKVMLQVQFYLVQDSGPNRLAIFSNEMTQIVQSLQLLPEGP